jgi:hypothetical protein
VNPVRPAAFPFAQPAGQATRPDAARTAAQKAFFEMALGKTPTAARPSAQAPDPVAEPVRHLVQSDRPEPGKIARPGSLLDIRV